MVTLGDIRFAYQINRLRGKRFLVCGYHARYEKLVAAADIDKCRRDGSPWIGIIGRDSLINGLVRESNADLAILCLQDDLAGVDRCHIASHNCIFYDTGRRLTKRSETNTGRQNNYYEKKNFIMHDFISR